MSFQPSFPDFIEDSYSNMRTMALRLRYTTFLVYFGAVAFAKSATVPNGHVKDLSKRTNTNLATGQFGLFGKLNWLVLI